MAYAMTYPNYSWYSDYIGGYENLRITRRAYNSSASKCFRGINLHKTDKMGFSIEDLYNMSDTDLESFRLLYSLWGEVI
jgi:hypothetical protein